MKATTKEDCVEYLLIEGDCITLTKEKENENNEYGCLPRDPVYTISPSTTPVENGKDTNLSAYDGLLASVNMGMRLQCYAMA